MGKFSEIDGMTAEEIVEKIDSIKAEKEEYRLRYKDCEERCKVLEKENEQMKINVVRDAQKELEKDEEIAFLNGKISAYEFLIERMYGNWKMNDKRKA